ncbi:MAG: peroxiredoxin [Balneolaceae bacterium]
MYTVRSISITTLLTFTLLLFSFSADAQDVNLEPGDPAPEFEAMSDNGELWQSSDHVGESLLVVYFYPAAMTGGCTSQACSFRDNRTKLTELGAEVVGISGDEVKSLQLFKRMNNLNFPLLSDPNGEIAKSFGVRLRDGGTITRVVDGEEVELTRQVTTARWTFIIDRTGTIVYKDTEVNASGDGEAVLSAIEQLVMN